MTILDITGALRITPDTIQYYVSCGLYDISTTGTIYREYSTAEFQHLARLVLLRHLGLSVDELLQLKQGERQLCELLSDHMSKLLADESSVTQAAIICQNIRRGGADFDTFDGVTHLEHLYEMEARGGVFFSPEEFSSQKHLFRGSASGQNKEQAARSTGGAAINNMTAHPFRRYFARSIDTSICMLVLSVLFDLVLRINLGLDALGNLLWLVLIYGLMFLTEPVVLALFGTTPGKWLLGIRVTRNETEKLSIKEAYYRCFLLFRYGFGFCIPFYSLYREIKSYQQCAAGTTLPWDENCCYQLTDSRSIRILFYITAFLVLAGLNVVISYQAVMPINRGDLTPEEFYENCNDLAEYLGADTSYYLSDTGTWEKAYDFLTLPNEESLMMTPRLTLSDGKITAVSYELTITNSTVISGIYTQMYIAAVAFAGAQKDVNCFTLQSASLNQRIDAFSPISFSFGNCLLTSYVEYEGYSLINSSTPHLYANNKTTKYYHLSFTMSLQ